MTAKYRDTLYTYLQFSFSIWNLETLVRYSYMYAKIFILIDCGWSLTDGWIQLGTLYKTCLSRATFPPFVLVIPPQCAQILISTFLPK